MSKIRKDDSVIVIAGKDKGSRGVVLSVGVAGVVVSGVNKVKKHKKPNPMRGVSGGIVELEKPIHLSNVAIYNATTKAADRVGYKVADGGKVRVYRSSGEVIA